MRRKESTLVRIEQSPSQHLFHTSVRKACRSTYSRNSARFLRGGDVLHLDAFDAQTNHRSERGHAMIGISLHHGRSKAARGYGRIFNPSGNSRASPPIRVISLTNASRRFVSCPRKWPMPIILVVCRRKPESQQAMARFTGSGQIEITQTVDGMSTCDFAITDAVLFRERHLRSHAFKIPRQQTTRLRGGFRPMRHTHGSAGDQRGAQDGAAFDKSGSTVTCPGS